MKINLNLNAVKSSALVVALAITSVGCGKSLSEYAKRASKEIGVPVAVLTNDNDSCARTQMESFYKEWKGLSKGDKASVRTKIKSKLPGGLVIRPTEVAATRTGNWTELYMAEVWCAQAYVPGPYYRYDLGGRFYWDVNYDMWTAYHGYWTWNSDCHRNFMTSKTLSDNRKLEGELGATTVFNNGDGTEALVAQRAEDQTTYTPFVTYWWSVYDRVDSASSLDFANAQMRGLIHNLDSSYGDTGIGWYDNHDSCGASATLAEIIE